ncbi:hypothetical protein ACQP3D_30750, partial [Escherichia coli]
RCYVTELTWRGFSLGEKVGGERGDWPVGTGPSKEKREAGSGGGREGNREREQEGRGAGPF